jgi:hypothetical protein
MVFHPLFTAEDTEPQMIKNRYKINKPLWDEMSLLFNPSHPVYHRSPTPLSNPGPIKGLTLGHPPGAGGRTEELRDSEGPD